MTDKPPTVREACRARHPLDGADAQALEHALTITERERDAYRAAGEKSAVAHAETLRTLTAVREAVVRAERERDDAETLRTLTAVREAVVRAERERDEALADARVLREALGEGLGKATATKRERTLATGRSARGGKRGK